MILRCLRSLAVATATMISLGAGSTNACGFFGEPDPVFWSAHATTIVDAAIVGFSRVPLTNPMTSTASVQGATTWMLKLSVHETIRGDPSQVRFVATRFWNTTIVDQRYLLNLLGKRKEFALVGLRGRTPTLFGETPTDGQFYSPDDLFPRHDGYHVLDASGEPIDEIWEGLCTALPVFEIGTLESHPPAGGRPDLP